MRIIKFRGKSKSKKEWIFGDLQTGIEKGKFYIITHGFPQVRVEVYPETVGQFTGLTDKNGKEIFEGDIVKHWEYQMDHSFHPTNKLMDEQTSKVYWSDSLAGWALYKDSEKETPMCHRHVFEITGNIYDK